MSKTIPLFSSIILLLMIILTIIVVPTYTLIVSAGTQQYFNIEGTSFRSRTGGNVYPGSQNAVLRIDAMFNGSLNATQVYAHIISAPNGFRFKDLNSPAYNYNNKIAVVVSPGQTIYFEYSVDIDRNVSPGVYTIELNITYYYNLTLHYQVSSIAVEISKYPSLVVKVIDTYWNPDGYPGETSAILNIVIENDADATITQAVITAYLHAPLEPNTTKTSTSNISPHTRATISINNLFIKPEAKPGTYNGELIINAKMMTSDGVSYTATSKISFSFRIEEPPKIDLKILDYGFAGDYPAPGARNVQLYLELQNMDRATIESIVAQISLQNANFMNGSKIGIITVNGPITYGHVFTIASPRLNITNTTNMIIVKYRLNLLLSYGGSTYWAHVNYTLNYTLKQIPYDIHLFYVHWGNEYAYPNSTDNSLVIGIANLMKSRLEGVEATLILPRNVFYPVHVHLDNVIINSGSVARLVFRGINIKSNVLPGNYTCVLMVRGLLVDTDGSYRPITINFTIIVPINRPNTPVKVLDYGFAGDYPGPGSRNTQLYLELQNMDRATIESVVVHIDLLNASFTNGSTTGLVVVNEPVEYGRVFTISSPRLEIWTNTSSIVVTYILDILLSDNGVNYWVRQNYVYVLKLARNNIDIHLAYAHWQSSKVYPGSSNQALIIGIENLMSANIKNAEAVLNLPKDVFYPNTLYIDGVTLSSGSISQLVFNGINIWKNAAPGNYTCVLMVRGLLVDTDGSYRPITINFTIIVSVSRFNNPLIRTITYRWITGKAYPNMNNTGIELLLQVIRNVQIKNIVATLVLPKGLWSQQTGNHNETMYVSGPYNYGSIIPLRFRDISIDPGVSGIVFIGVRIDFQAIINRADTWINQTILLKLNISSPERILEIVSSRWTNGHVYPHTAYAGIIILTRINDDITIEKLSVKIIYPHRIISLNTNTSYDVWYTNAPHQYGDIVTIQFNNIEINGAKPGLYKFMLTYSGILSINGGNAYFNITKTIRLPISKPTLNVILINTSWNVPAPSHTMNNAGINILLYDNQTGTITQFRAKLLLPEGLTSSDGRKYIISTFTGTIQYAETFTLSFSGINVNTTQNKLMFTLYLYARVDDSGTIYILNKTMRFYIEITPTNKTFILARIATTYNGQPAPILPTAKGTTLIVTLLNIRSYTVSSLVATLILPKGFQTIGYNKTIAGPVSPGSPVSLSYRLNIGNVNPGIYKAKLKILFTRTNNGAVITQSQTITIYLVIDDPNKYVPRLEIIDVHWGTTSPIYVYPGMRNEPISITIVNNGQYPAYNVKLLINSSNAIPLDKMIYVANSIAPGASVRAIAYFDLGRSRPGIVPINITIKYQIRAYGADLDRIYTTNYSLAITKPETLINNTDLYLIRAGWRNNWPVYPGTKNAEYTFTIANLLPYSVEGILAKLIVPKEFKPHTNHSLTTYIAGPISSLQTITGSFRLDVEGQPGIYKAYLMITYHMASGGPGLRKTIVIPLMISISDPANAITIITYGWQSGQPTLDMKGAKYYVVIRNNEIPQIQYPVLYVKLPRGIYYAYDNSSIARAPASAAIIPQTPSTSMANQPSVEQILKLISSQTQRTTVTTTTKGALISFIIPLNLCLKHPGKYMVDANLSYIDPWGSQYNLTIKFPILVEGKPAKLGITASPMIIFHNGTTWFTLSLNNTSPSPIYNVYIILAPMAPLALPIDNIKYIPVIGPCRQVNITYRLVYNPMNMITYGGGTPVSYASIPFKIAIIYRDATGALDIYNTTISSQVKPFIDIGISSDTKAKYSGGTLSVSGVLINYGITQARSVDVTIIYGNERASNFVGDIDAASQMAFKVTLHTSRLTGKTVTLEITYRDMYNNLYFKTYTLPIEVENATSLQPAQATSTGQPTLMHYLIIGMVAAFLIGVFILIYRFSRRHAKKLGI